MAVDRKNTDYPGTDRWCSVDLLRYCSGDNQPERALEPEEKVRVKGGPAHETADEIPDYTPCVTA